MKDNRTLAELAQEALHIQSACNVSGLVFGWARAMERLNELLPGIGTNARNSHPVNVLWAGKLAELTGARYGQLEDECFKQCQALANGEEAAAAAEVCPF